MSIKARGDNAAVISRLDSPTMGLQTLKDGIDDGSYFERYIELIPQSAKEVIF